MSKKYEEAGVSLEAGYDSVRRIKKHVERTKIKGCMGNIGAFGGMFDLSQYNIKNPVLVSGTDGVGTKLKIAIEMDKHDTIGQDVVAMCVNDVIVQGAKPLYFLDYVAVGKNRPEHIEQVVKGVADGCVIGECALIGGETAEMPGMYSDKDYDIAGFAVGVVEKDELITGKEIEKGDIIVGIASSGVHSNGFSLVRKIIKDANLDLNKIYFGSKTLGESLLEPTRIYTKTVRRVLENIKVKGMVHVTGGGFYENIPRVIPEKLGIELELSKYEIPEIFKFLGEKGELSKEEMCNVFNMGIGYIFIIDREKIEEIEKVLNEIGEKYHIIGKVIEGEGLKIKW